MKDGEADARLREECQSQLQRRYRESHVKDASRSLDKELDMISDLGLVQDFLAAAEIHQYSLKHHIPCRLIGAGCSSMVCYVLGLTEVDPLDGDLVFERFCDPRGRRPVEFTFEVPEDERERFADFAGRQHGDEYVQDRFWFAIMPRIVMVPQLVLWLVEEKEGRPFYLGKLSVVSRSPHDDRETFAKIQAGDTEGVFLLDRPDLRSRLPELAPRAVEDLAAIMALDMITIDQDGVMEEYLQDGGLDHFPGAIREVVDRVLGDTRSLILYQEQVMLLLSAFGGIELSDGYIVVREAAKRKQAVVEEYRGRFLRKASGKLGKADAEDLFAQLAQASVYACCKSHHMADAMTSFQAAYMKTHHPAEFREILGTIQANT